MNNKISIIIPTYNVEKYISRALDSCINQTYKNIEIIVVDDCGNDDSIKVAYEYANKDNRIKIIHNKNNLKLFHARYEGVKSSTSDYIIFLDSDDWLELNICENINEILNKNEMDLIVFGSTSNKLIKYNPTKPYIFFYKNGIKGTVKEGIYNINDYCFFPIKYKRSLWQIWGKVFKRDIYLKTFEQINVDIKINMCEDILFFYHYLFNVNKVYVYPYLGYYYFINSKSITNIKNKDKLLSYINEEDFVINIINKKHFNIDKNLDYLKDLSEFYLYCLYKEKYKRKLTLKELLNKSVSTKGK